MARLTKIIDASIAVKWFAKEQGWKEALKLKEDYIARKVNLIIPELLFYELINALKYKAANKAVIFDAINTLFTMQLRVEALNEILSKELTEIAMQYNISAYDAAYVALAELFDCELITADEKLINKKIGNISHIRDY